VLFTALFYAGFNESSADRLSKHSVSHLMTRAVTRHVNDMTSLHRVYDDMFYA